MNKSNFIYIFRASVEVFLRQIYWRCSLLQKSYSILRSNKSSRALKILDLYDLREFLKSNGVGEGSCLMVHSSTDGIGLRIDGNVIQNKLQVASELLKLLKSIIGHTGTLVMPTHPYYRDDPGFMFTKSNLQFTYDPLRTPSKVGLLTEIFRRSAGSIRSRHPLSSITATGPLALEIIGGFPQQGDLPHGKNSAYKRFCDAGGVIVGINLPFISALTIVHVAEELRDNEWNVEGFFYERTFNIVEEGINNPVTVRERHPKWVRSISLNVLRSDLVKEGHIIERNLGEVGVGFAHGTKVVDYMVNRNLFSTYPYFFLKRSKHGRQ